MNTFACWIIIETSKHHHMHSKYKCAHSIDSMAPCCLPRCDDIEHFHLQHLTGAFIQNDLHNSYRIQSEQWGSGGQQQQPDNSEIIVFTFYFINFVPLALGYSWPCMPRMFYMLERKDKLHTDRICNEMLCYPPSRHATQPSNMSKEP